MQERDRTKLPHCRLAQCADGMNSFGRLHLVSDCWCGGGRGDEGMCRGGKGGRRKGNRLGVSTQKEKWIK